MKKTVKILGRIAIGVIATAVLVTVLMLLWNNLLPSIFGLSEINFWQALGILVLSKILFGGFGFGRHRYGHRHPGRNQLRERWMEMSDEERKEFLKHRRHFGLGRDFFKDREPEKED